jgi:flagellar basal body-associated protein FliL
MVRFMSEEAKSGGGNKGMMMIIMAMLGLIIVALVGVGVFLITNLAAFTGGDAPPDGSIGDGHVVPGAVPPISEQIMFNLSEAIATNLGTTHFVRLENMALGINNTDPAETTAFMLQLASSERAIMDTIHRILRNTNIEDLSRPEGADLLREDILEALQLQFNSPMIVAIYLTVYTVPI